MKAVFVTNKHVAINPNLNIPAGFYSRLNEETGAV
jgi:hypothetical protein